jgi:hypothetical protein
LGKTRHGSPDGSIYATAAYLENLCLAAGGRFRMLGIRRGDQLLRGKPLYEQPSKKGIFVSGGLRTGQTGNDLTDATLNSVSRFKSQLGGDLVTISWSKCAEL